MHADSPLPDEAAALLRRWLGEDWAVHPLFGDASVRAYYRVTRPGGESYILTWYPAELHGDLRRFLVAYTALEPHALVPRVLDRGESAVLQADVGSRTLFDILHDDRETGVRLYRRAIELLAAFQKADGRAVNPPFDAEFFLNELHMTREFYVEQLMSVPPAEAARLEKPFRKLCGNVERHPYVLCHRDYHGQNIHLFNDQLFIIDYQDMRMGPDTYDMASLLRDRGVARILGEPAEMELLAYYARVTGADGALRHRYFEVLLQRSLKVLGTFAKMPIVRGRLHYLEFIPPAIDSVRRALDELPDFQELAALLPTDFDLAAARTRVAALERNPHS